MSTGYEGQVETHKHTFAVADVGDWDLDEDRSIVPSIQNALKYEGIDAVVDGEEMNSSVFYVYTKSPRDVVEQALENQQIYLENQGVDGFGKGIIINIITYEKGG